ncbi:MAG: symmetrical bis(5'-nucleosyl)-tetraphosphatase [Sulfurovaceae bacterium]|nr:symmetrical bis(5'-nucleosyl)-tetraphosphatase [Sulfurovaceae bacterium]
MAVWAIGDIQGCYDSLIKLLKKIKFDKNKDTLWIAGDLVNRGDKSLEVLNYLYSMRDSIKVVLGNHDISLIATYYGLKKPNDTIRPIIEAPNTKELIDWLRFQPFLVWNFELDFMMSHAGISPQFDFGMAVRYASRIQKKLRAKNPKPWLKDMLKPSLDIFNANASSIDIDRYILSSFTRMRFCKKDGSLDFYQKGKPKLSKVEYKGLYPWFACPSRRSTTLKVVFGHWSTLGYWYDSNVLCLDTGCLWGRELTAVRLDKKKPVPVQVKCKKKQDF